MTQDDELQLLKNELRNEPNRLENIRPSMFEEDRPRTLDEIARVLRGEV